QPRQPSVASSATEEGRRTTRAAYSRRGGTGQARAVSWLRQYRISAVLCGFGQADLFAQVHPVKAPQQGTPLGGVHSAELPRETRRQAIGESVAIALLTAQIGRASCRERVWMRM